MTGWRLGWALLPTPNEAQIFKQLNINSISCVPPFIQEAGRVALESPESVSTVDHMVSAFQGRRDFVASALNAIPGVTCQVPKGAFYVFPNVAGVCERLGIIPVYEGLSADARARTSPSRMLQGFLLERYGVATMDRNSFGRIGADGEHFLRLSIAASLERLREGIKRMQQAFSDKAGWTEYWDASQAGAPADPSRLARAGVPA
jgi:aspartate/methionine/tyrosine aminotransferase